MYYEINVSKRTGTKNPEYRHFFATSKRSCMTSEDAAKVLYALMKAFPEPEYDIIVNRWEETGEGVNPKDLLKLLK